MDLTFQVPMQFCSLQHQTLLPSPVISTTGCCFLLWLHLLILSGVISPLISNSLLGTSWPGEFIFQCPIFLPCQTVHGFSKNTEVVCHSLLQWTTFCQNSQLWPMHLGWSCTAWLIVSLNYTRLWSLWSDWLVFCDCGFHSVCLLRDKEKSLPYGSILMGETDWGENRVLFWWVACSVNL